LYIAGANEKMNIVDFLLIQKLVILWSAGGFFFSEFGIFWEQINPKLVAIYPENLQKKVRWINYEWFKSSNAVFYPLIGVMVLYFSIQ
jgi:hypothetical protein